MTAAQSKFHELLRTQIRNEFTASQQYTAVAVHCDDQDPPAARRALLRAGARGAQPRDGHGAVPARQRPAGAPSRASTTCATTSRRSRTSSSWCCARSRPSPTRSTTLARTARDEGDYLGEQFMQWYLKEQVEEVASMTTLLRHRAPGRRQPLPRRGLRRPRDVTRPRYRPHRSARRRRQRRSSAESGTATPPQHRLPPAGRSSGASSSVRWATTTTDRQGATTAAAMSATACSSTASASAWVLSPEPAQHGEDTEHDARGPRDPPPPHRRRRPRPLVGGTTRGGVLDLGERGPGDREVRTGQQAPEHHRPVPPGGARPGDRRGDAAREQQPAQEQRAGRDAPPRASGARRA